MKGDKVVVCMIEYDFQVMNIIRDDKISDGGVKLMMTLRSSSYQQIVIEVTNWEDPRIIEALRSGQLKFTVAP